MHAILVISVLVVLNCFCGVSWACAPTDDDADSRYIKEYLTTDQLAQIDRARIDELKNDPAAFEAARYDEEIIKLTPQQEENAIRNNPGFFKSGKDLPPLNTDQSGGRVQKRQAGVQKCPPNPSWSALTLALNAYGELVQVIQPSGSSQWILDETCQSSSYGQDSCDRTSRLIAAYVIDFQTYAFEVEWIRVYCCVTYA